MGSVLNTEKEIRVSILGGGSLEGRITDWDERHGGFILEVKNPNGASEKVFITLRAVATITTVQKARRATDRG